MIRITNIRCDNAGCASSLFFFALLFCEFLSFLGLILCLRRKLFVRTVSLSIHFRKTHLCVDQNLHPKNTITHTTRIIGITKIILSMPSLTGLFGLLNCTMLTQQTKFHYLCSTSHCHMYEAPKRTTID